MSVTEEVKLKFDEVKKKKAFRYVVFYIRDEKAIAVEKTGKTLNYHANHASRATNYANVFIYFKAGVKPSMKSSSPT